MSPSTKGAWIPSPQECGLVSGEIALCAAIIDSAVNDLRRPAVKDNASARTLKPRLIEQRSAVAFFTGPNSNFPWMIAAIGAHADVVVATLRDDIETTQKQIDRMVKLLPGAE